MNIENKIKLLEKFKSNSWRKSAPIGAVIKEDEFDSYESLIDSKKLNFDFLRFLSVQLPENRKFIYEELSSYENIEKLIELTEKEYPIVSRENIKWVTLYLECEYSISQNIRDFNYFLGSVHTFKVDNGYHLTKHLLKKTKDSYYKISYSKLVEVLKNVNFNNFSFEEVFNVISNAKPVVDLSVLDRRTIELYTDKITTTFSDVTEDNFNFVKNIEKLYGFDYLKNISLYIDNLLEYKDYINSILEVLDEDEHLKYLKMLVNLFIICHRNDCTSLVKDCFDKLYMKMSYGTRVEDLREMFQIGFEVDVKRDDSDISYSEIFNLAKVKSIGSKGLYKKVKSDSYLTYLASSNVKYLSDVSHLINLGQLNESEIYTLIEELNSGYYRHISLLSDIPYKLSFKEFEYAVKYALPRKVFDYVSNLKINSRIKVFDILLEADANNCELYSTNNIIENILAEDLLKRHNVFGSTNIQDYIKWKLAGAKVGFEIDSLDELNKINTFFDLCGEDYFIGVSKDNINVHLLNNDFIKDGFKNLNISNDFVLENLSNAIEFIVDGGFKIATSYFNNYHAKKLQKENLTLIVKSILAGKYNDLKFNYSDIFKEIEIDMPENNFKAWSVDHEISNEIFTIKDAGDFNTIMTIGAKPVRSCMNYVSGAYSQCLLSNIDTAKKILTIYKNAAYVGRAILRLTKSSPTGDNTKRLSFIDVENEVSTDIDNSDENLVLFVEKLYTSLDTKDLNDMYDLMIEFLRFKSDLIGAKLMVSSSYTKMAEQSSIPKVIEPNYIFITASKNGEQYLDSFDGSTSSSCCYKKANVLLY